LENFVEYSEKVITKLRQVEEISQNIRMQHQQLVGKKSLRQLPRSSRRLKISFCLLKYKEDHACTEVENWWCSEEIITLFPIMAREGFSRMTRAMTKTETELSGWN